MSKILSSVGSTWVVVTPLLVIAVTVGILIYRQQSSLVETGSREVRNGHHRMLDQLRILSEHTKSEHPIFGLRKLRSAQDHLNSLTSDSPLEVRIGVYSSAGDLELMAGETELAAGHLASAYKLLEPVRDRVPPELEAKALMDVAVAHLRLAEVQNCIHCNTCDSCILPIRKTGVHVQPAPSRQAIGYLKRLIELQPNNLKARWLLNIAYMTLGEYPTSVPDEQLVPEQAFESAVRFPRFINHAQDAGVDTLTLSGGVVADDFDGDGWIDIMTSDWAVDGQLRLFRNTSQGTFIDTTESAGLLGLFGGLNLVQSDFDNDGDVDVFVLRGAWSGSGGLIPNSLLQNDGSGHFVDISFESGLAEENFPTGTAAWSDYDNDGDLDLFVGNETYPCQLFQNDGAGHFMNVAERAGVTNDRFTKGCTWGDIDNDGYPDLYVSNYGAPPAPKPGVAVGLFDAHDGQPNRLYRNNRDGTFTDIALETGVTSPKLGFPTWFWDYNNDGNLDLFAASYSGDTSDVAAQFLGLPQTAEPDRLYLGNGLGEFRDVSAESGIDRVSQTMGANFGDLDNDGFDDFYLGTGAPSYDAIVPNVMYRNRAGENFENVTTPGGFGHLQKGHAIAFADFDNDGDQDIFAVLGGAYNGDSFANALFINPGFENRWLKVELVGKQSNRGGIGARVKVEIEEAGQV
ncbi:MAG: VCBS repeat-containing protein, partial [Aureliella sp.]